MELVISLATLSDACIATSKGNKMIELENQTIGRITTSFKVQEQMQMEWVKASEIYSCLLPIAAHALDVKYSTKYKLEDYVKRIKKELR
jgi:aminopeptidase-like protein